VTVTDRLTDSDRDMTHAGGGERRHSRMKVVVCVYTFENTREKD
jgi:hypothetical protein